MLDPPWLGSGWDLQALTEALLWEQQGEKKYGGSFPFLEPALSLES